MPFRFRLEKVARYRRQLVDEQSRAVARAGRVVATIEARMAALDDDIARQRARGACGGPDVSVRGMMSRTLWIEHLVGIREDHARELAVARLAFDAERAKLAAAWRDQEILEKLRAQQKAAWEAEERRRENRDLDEIGQIRADRQRRSKIAS